MTKSERLFESWCEVSGFNCEKIPESVTRTPDFRVTSGKCFWYAEVKEIVATSEENKSLELLEERGWGIAYGEKPGKTVREKIKTAYPQLKGHCSKNDCSGVLVLYNNSGTAGLGRINSYHVLTAMFGLQTVNLRLRHESESICIGEYLGSEESVSPKRNRYLSAILSLYEHHEKGVVAFIYHNPFAEVPLPLELFNSISSTQYELCEESTNWRAVG